MSHKVRFIEDSHRYINEESDDLISVSRFTERFKQKQDWDAIAKKCAAKETKKGILTTKEEILRKWANKRDRSSEIGTLYHSIREQELIDEEETSFYNIPCTKKTCWNDDNYKYSIAIDQLQNNTVYPELMIYDMDHMICGQSDKVIVIGNTIHIWDYKGLALDTEIPTKDGFKLMRDIKQGDSIFDGDGNLTTVENVSIVHYNPCYKITFDTNDTIICDHEHKWLISERLAKNKYRDLEVRTDQLIGYNKPLRIKCSPLNIEDIELPIDPYVLGAWLGDGNSYFGRITNMNQELWNEIRKRGYQIGNDVSGGGSGKAEDRTIFSLSLKLKELNLIANKHLPEIYLRSSFKQRLDILRGFMDTDGHYHRKRKRCVMYTTKEWQANAIMELVGSLGWKGTKMYTVGKGFGKTGIKVIQVTFDTNGENPFLTRNKDFVNKNSEKSKYRYIKKIEKIDTVPTKCISVTSKSHTYLTTRSYIKTHNTDAEIAFKAWSSEWVKPRKLLEPLQHLDDCSANIYSIKMSLYMYMLWKANNGRFKPGDIIIEHVHLKRDPNNDNIPVLENGQPVVLKIEQITLPYRKKEVMAMLATIKQKV